jgi:hypothetical protein
MIGDFTDGWVLWTVPKAGAIGTDVAASLIGPFSALAGAPFVGRLQFFCQRWEIFPLRLSLTVPGKLGFSIGFRAAGVAACQAKSADDRIEIRVRR